MLNRRELWCGVVMKYGIARRVRLVGGGRGDVATLRECTRLRFVGGGGGATG